MPLVLVKSGGQNGVDQAGLMAAKVEGFKTGGEMPRGYLTLDGPRPDLAEIYGLTQHPTRQDYPPRTYSNVKSTDATLRLYYDPHSSGEICTLKAIHFYKKPYLDVDLRSPQDPKKVALWIVKNDFNSLNVAGNSLRKYPRIQEVAFNYLILVFREVKKLDSNAILPKTVELEFKGVIRLTSSVGTESKMKEDLRDHLVFLEEYTKQNTDMRLEFSSLPPLTSSNPNQSSDDTVGTLEVST